MGSTVCFEMKREFGTYEWADSTINIINGCRHNCRYCFSREMASRFKRKDPTSWENEELNLKQYNQRIPQKDGIIMFPSTHDITPDNLQYTLPFIVRILERGNRVLVVSKPHIECVTRICSTCAQYRDRILFRFTIGSKNNDTLSFWEPNAPNYEERKESLIYAFNNGFRTSLSCEPMLDEDVEALIEDLQNYVSDEIWVGKMNFVLRRLHANGYYDLESVAAAKRILDIQSDENIVALVARLNDNPKIRWKDSIKAVMEKHMDVR